MLWVLAIYPPRSLHTTAAAAAAEEEESDRSMSSAHTQNLI